VGSDLLVAPVISEGAVTRSVYLPSGSQWRDWWTGLLYEGGTEIGVNAPIERLPLFLRAGAALMRQPVMQHTGEMRFAPLGITAISSGSLSTSTFYEDDGEGFDYKAGSFRLSKIQHTTGRLSFNRSAGLFSPRRIEFVEFLGLESAPEEVSFNNQLISDIAFNEGTRRLLVPLPENGDNWVLTYTS